MFKKTLVWLVVICMLLTAMPVTVFADAINSGDTAGTGILGNTNNAAANAEAKIGTAMYDSLADALAAGGNVVLLRDVTVDSALVIPEGVTVTLDLNGKSISQEKTQTTHYSMLVNNGNLSIRDLVGGGKISYTDTGVGGEYVSNTIANNGTLTVYSGRIENLSSATVAKNGYPHAIDTKGTLKILGGVIECAT